MHQYLYQRLHQGITVGICLLALAACATEPAPPAAPEPATEPAASAPVRPVPPPKPAWRIAPERLYDLRPGEVTALIGPPHLIRHDGPAYITLHEDDGCVLETVFYETAPAGEFRAARLTARSRDTGGAVDYGMCLTALLDGDVPDRLKDAITEDPDGDILQPTG